MGELSRCQTNGRAISGTRSKSSNTCSDDPDEATCWKCGLASGEVDWTTGQIAILNSIDRIEGAVGGPSHTTGLERICSICEEGAEQFSSDKPTSIWLLSQIRRAGRDEQLAVLKWLSVKFKDDDQTGAASKSTASSKRSKDLGK